MEEFLRKYYDELRVGEDDLEGICRKISMTNAIMYGTDVAKLRNSLVSEKFKRKHKKYYDILKNNIKFYNIHKGQRCFILGNGPSLGKQDLSLLSDEYVFTVSHIHRYEYCDSLHINYHFYCDPFFFRKDTEIEEVASVKKEYLNSLRYLTGKKDVTCFISTMGYDEIQKCGGIKKENMAYYSSPLFFYDGYDEEFDFCEPIPSFQTVIHWAIAMAIYMGFKEIYLLGCDCTNILSFLCPEQEIHMYKKNEMDIAAQEYIRRQSGLELQFQGWGRIFHLYKQLYEYCNRRDTILANCSGETVLDCIPRIKYEDVIRAGKKYE